MKILVVEDNPILRENLVFLLKKFNFFGEGVSDGKKALEKVSLYKYDGIILDVNMPILNGKEFLKQIRNNQNFTPVIALTSDSMLQDKLEMFELGVDDYMSKPFEIEELIARLKSILKRGAVKIDEKKEIGDVTINYSTKKIFYKGQEVVFSFKQYLIVEYLTMHFGYPKNKSKIMEYVWGEAEENLEFDSTTLESHIYAIRKRLGKDFIKTIKGIGYIIE